MTEAEFAALYPRLWHVAHDGAWPAIRDGGLLSVSALLDLYRVSGPRREALESRRRAVSEVLSAPGLPGAVIRDQGPLSRKLAGCLDDGLTPEAWLRLLNARVYFWPTARMAAGLLAAKRYRGTAQTVLTLDTASLLEAHGPHVRLSPINSGATEPFAARRGLSTFRTVADHPGAERRRVKEVTVDHAVPDIAAHVLAVERAAGGRLERLWLSPRAGADEGVAAPARANGG